jgi:uncharacterized protein YabE (DUF348 family)
MQIFNSYFNKLVHAHAFAFGVFVALFAFVFFAGGLVVANGQTLGPSDSKIVNLYIDGEQQSMPTRAETVESFLKNAGITLGQFDLVEPNVKTEIQEDNFNVQVYRAKPVTIIDGQNTERVMTPYDSAQLVAEKAGLKTYPEDNLTFIDTDNFVESQILGQKLIIDRAIPATVSLYGTPAVTYRSHAKTVGELLDEKGIVAEAGATLSPTADTKLTNNTAIFISKFGKKVLNQEEDVAFPVNSTPDPTAPLGKITVTTAGKKGKKQVVYEVTMRDGKEVARTKIQEVITVEPQAQVQTKGTKATVIVGDRLTWLKAAGIAESDYMYVDYIIGHEGGWNGTTKWNKAGSGAYGICQALPASKMASAGADYMTNPVTQLKWCTGYAVGRYGSWYGAYQAWIVKGWW